MKIVLMAASSRQGSLNRKLITSVQQALAGKITAHEVELLHLKDFEVPLYDGDLETAQGVPDGAVRFCQKITRSDALILSSPEYNFSMPGVLKNLIDWVSRIKPMPWKGRYILLMSASPSQVGGVRGLWHLRVPLEGCGSFVYPDMYSLAAAHQAFLETGAIKDAALADRLEKLLVSFVDHVERNVSLIRLAERSV